MSRKTKKLTQLALLTAVSLVIFVAEAQIPPVVPIPGVKLGLANIITLVAMAAMGRKEALAVFFVRVLLGSAFAGGVPALLFSLAGGFCAWAVMTALLGVFGRKLIWVTSIFGALGHNAGQLVAAVLILRTPSILYYGFALAAAGVLTGAFTGLAAKAVLSRWKLPPPAGGGS